MHSFPNWPDVPERLQPPPPPRMPWWEIALWLLVVALIVGLTVFFTLAAPARARDLSGQYDNDPNHSWFEQQHNAANTPCCEIADGHQVDDADWHQLPDGHYEVRLDGKWVPVPEIAVINPKDRPVSYAVVWIFQGIIECFMPGAGV